MKSDLELRSVNLNSKDMKEVDKLIDYSNGDSVSRFIREAIREKLNKIKEEKKNGYRRRKSSLKRMENK
jgi:metal-responsive CopG/Arc/MetJ family transcriptional regulator